MLKSLIIFSAPLVHKGIMFCVVFDIVNFIVNHNTCTLTLLSVDFIQQGKHAVMIDMKA